MLDRAIQPEVRFADSAGLNPMTTPALPEQFEVHRDRMWRRDEDLHIERVVDAERFMKMALQIRGQIPVARPSFRHCGVRLAGC